MATTVAVGVDANITFITGHNACFDTFSFMVGQRLISTTCFGDTYEGVRGGLKYGSWSAEGKPKFDASSTAPGLGGTTITKGGGTITLTIASGCTYAFTGIIERGGISADVNGGQRLSYSGVTSGSITETWDETS